MTMMLVVNLKACEAAEIIPSIVLVPTAPVQ